MGPVIGIGVGSAALAGAAAYLKNAAIGLLALAGLLLALSFYRRQRAPACATGCGCRPGACNHS